MPVWHNCAKPATFPPLPIGQPRQSYFDGLPLVGQSLLHYAAHTNQGRDFGSATRLWWS